MVMRYILVLRAALLLVLGLALLHCTALLPLHWLALAPIKGGALGHRDGLTLLSLTLHILDVPDCLLLRPALNLWAAVGRSLSSI